MAKKYFISYTWAVEGRHGFGNVEMERESITSMEDVLAIQKELLDRQPKFNWVVIIGWQPFETKPKAKKKR